MAVDWSFGNFTDKVGGLLTDPEQAQNLAGNPLFNVGMGLLAHRQDKSVNPFLQAITGLQQAGAQGRIQDEQSRDDQLRQALAKFFAQQGGVPPGMPGPDRAAQFGQMPGGAPTAPGQPEPGRDYYSYGWGDILNSGT